MITTLILFILILGVTVLVHEFGHFLFSKIFGVCVYEFSVGMGPTLISIPSKKSETTYSIRLIPFGGFCSLAGEEIDEEELKKTKGRNLQDKSLIQRFLIMFMGVGFNFIFAFIVLFLSAIISGAPNTEPIISGVVDNYPAKAVGLEKGDRILYINNHKVTYKDDISLYLTIEDLKKPVSIQVEKEDKTIKTYTLKAKQETVDNKKVYHVGINFISNPERGFIKSLEYSIKEGSAIFKQMFVVLKSLFTGKLSINSLSGPVGIYSAVGTVKKQGISSILYLIALLCINVGVINILPFPAFDGGRILFLIIEKIKGSKVSPKIENTIHAIGFILLILLMIYVTFNDVIRLF